MTGEQLDAILKTAQAKPDKDGWNSLPEGGLLTLYLAYHGASLTVPRVEALRTDGPLLYARTPRRELFAVAREDLFAVAVEGAVMGQPTRRAGFA